MYSKIYFRKKIIAIFGIIVALFIAWLFLSLYNHILNKEVFYSKDNEGQGYIRKGNKIYYRSSMTVYDGGNSHPVTNDAEVKNADAFTFTTFSGNVLFGKDKNNIFYTGEILAPKIGTPPADVKSFSLLKGETSFAKTKSSVYYISYTGSQQQSGYVYSLIQNADPETFTLMYPYAKDKNNVYYIDLGEEGVEQIKGLDANSFSVINECSVAEVYHSYYAKDDKHVVAGNAIVANADPNTFKIVANFESIDGMYIKGTYSVDKNNVYKNCGEVIPKANPLKCSLNDLKSCDPDTNFKETSSYFKYY